MHGNRIVELFAGFRRLLLAVCLFSMKIEELGVGSWYLALELHGGAWVVLVSHTDFSRPTLCC